MWKREYGELRRSKKILVVGAEDIGNKLLKKLIFSGFKNIHVYDGSKLSGRFQREHGEKSMAEVATAAVRRLVTDTKIVFKKSSITKILQFDPRVFEGYDCIMSALDHKRARTHVYEMCRMRSGTPLVESGLGGQITTYQGDKVKPYQCTVYEPEQIACTVWSMHLFNKLFGKIDIDDNMSPDGNDAGSKEDGAAGKTLEMLEGDVRPKNFRTLAEGKNYVSDLFKLIFEFDIECLVKMDEHWEERKRPVPVTLIDLDEIECSSNEGNGVTHDVKQIWSAAQCGKVFVDSVAALSGRKAKLPEGSILTWDRDDDEAMRFVAACAKIRALTSGFPMKTAFEIKNMTDINNMVADQMVCVVDMILQGKFSYKEYCFDDLVAFGEIVREEMEKERLINLLNANSMILLNTKKMTLKNLKDKVLKSALKFVKPKAQMNGQVIIDSEADEKGTEGWQTKQLAEMKIGDGDMLFCEDIATDRKVAIYVHSVEKYNGDYFEIYHREDKKKEEPMASSSPR